MKILVSIPLDSEAGRTFLTSERRMRIEAAGTVVWNESNQQFTPDRLKELLPGTDLMMTGWGSTPLSEELLPYADNLKLIAHTGGTVAGLVCDTAWDKGVRVSSGNEIFAESVAEGCIGYMLAALRDIPLYNQRCHAGGWVIPGRDANEGLLDQTVGLLGIGAVARHLIRFLKMFRCRIKADVTHLSDAELEALGVERAQPAEIFTTCKLISVQLARTPATYHYVSRALLESMPDGTIFVNTARGACVDEEALVDVLQKNPTIKAVLDVFEQEPLPPHHKLTQLGNAILIPHMAGPTWDRRTYVTEKVFDDALSYLEGRNPLRYEITREQARFMTR